MINSSTGVFTAAVPVGTGGKVRATVGALTADLDLTIIAGGAFETQNTAAASSDTYYGFATSGTTAHAVTGSGAGLKYYRSTTSGASFAAAVVLDADTSCKAYLDTPIAALGNLVVIAYTKDIVNITDFFGTRASGVHYIVRSTDDGVTWSAPLRVSDTSARSFRHSLSLSGTKAFLVWMDYRGEAPTTGSWNLRCAWSNDSAATWSADTLLVEGVNQLGASRPSADFVGDLLVVTWMDGRDGNPSTNIEGGTFLPQSTEAYAKVASFTNGNAPVWGADQRLTNNATTYSGRPHVKILTGGTILIVYDERISGADNEIASMYSTDGGLTWSAITRITASAGVSTHGYIGKSAISGRAYIAWMDDRSGNKIFMNTTNDGGRSFGVEQQASTAGASAVPFIACTTGYANVLWDVGGALIHRRFTKPAL